MPIFAIILLVTGAFLHTAWNLLLKQSGEKYIATWWLVTIGGAASLIALFFTGLPPREIWIFAFFSILAETLYFLTLSYAYRENDFSLIYPIARGAAPAFLALWSYLFLRERLTHGGLIGLGLIIGGLVVIGASALLRGGLNKVHFRGVAAALLLALLISTYTAIDGAAVKHGLVLSYALLVFALVPVPVTPFVFRQYGWARLKEAWNAQPVQLSMAGLLGIVAYLFALAAYSIAPLSYSGAIREVSVVIGAFAGWQFLGEKMGGLRVIGAAVIFAGIMMIALYG